MKKLATAAITAAVCLTGASSAHADRASCSKPLETHYSANYHAVKKQHGTRAPGRNIRKLGVRYRHRVDGKPTRSTRAARCHELRRSLRQLRALRAPVGSYLTRRAVRPAQRPAGVLTAGVRAALPACTWVPESRGNYRAYNASSGAAGKYQIIPSTWRAFGGLEFAPTALQATESEQDEVAARIARDGLHHWVNC
jgi:hypothetical protein